MARRASPAALLAAALLAAGCAERQAGASGSGQNLLLLTLCGVRPDILDGCVADGSAPNLAALRRRAAVAAAVTSASTDCHAAHAALLASLAPELASSGHHAAAFVSRSELHAGRDVARGFAEFSTPSIDRFALAFVGPGAASTRLRRGAAATAEAARSWLARATTPFFLWVQLDGLAVEGGGEEPPGRERARARLLEIDAALGPLLDVLRRAGRDARTIVAVAGDHGEALGGAEGFGHRRPLPAVLAVPLWIVDPGETEAGRWPSPASSRELAPALARRLLPGSPLAALTGREPGGATAPGRRVPGSGRTPWFVERGDLPPTEEQARAWLPALREVDREAGAPRDPACLELHVAALLALPSRNEKEEAELRELAGRAGELPGAEHPFAATFFARADLHPAPVDPSERMRAAAAAVSGAPWYFPAVRALASLRQLQFDPAGALAALEEFGARAPLAPAARVEFERMLEETRALLARPRPR